MALTLATGLANLQSLDEETRDAIGYFQNSRSALENHIQKSVRENPQYAPPYNELRADFPADYERQPFRQ